LRRLCTSSQRLFARLHAGLHADHVGDLVAQPPIEIDEEVDAAARAAIEAAQKGGEIRADGRRLEEGTQLALEPGVVGEGNLLGFRLEEEVERIHDRELGLEVHLDLEAIDLVGEHDAREPVRLRVLLPVEEVRGRLDAQRVGDDRRAAVRRGAQSHDLRREAHQPIVCVASAMIQGDAYGHGSNRWSVQLTAQS
jgi:hypothetical protein